jgi:hypothetical protein
MTTTNELRRFTITSIEGDAPDGTSHRVRSDYVEDEWMPYLGPVTIILARKIDAILSTNHKYAIDVSKWAEQMAISPEDLIAACHRLVRWGLATWGDRDPTLFISRHWPQVPACVATPLHRRVLVGLPDMEMTS